MIRLAVSILAVSVSLQLTHGFSRSAAPCKNAKANRVIMRAENDPLEESEAPPSPPPLKSLLVVGAGVLGKRIASQYWEKKVGLVTCETRTETSHADLLAELPFLTSWDAKRPDPKGCCYLYRCARVAWVAIICTCHLHGLKSCFLCDPGITQQVA
jgi:hypothetical protein